MLQTPTICIPPKRPKRKKQITSVSMVVHGLPDSIYCTLSVCHSGGEIKDYFTTRERAAKVAQIIRFYPLNRPGVQVYTMPFHWGWNAMIDRGRGVNR